MAEIAFSNFVFKRVRKWKFWSYEFGIGDDELTVGEVEAESRGKLAIPDG